MRLSTGVIGLDEKIQGGFVEGSINLITGKTGTGKTAFCASFLYQGAKDEEPGIYVTTEESKKDIVEDIKSMFNWDFMHVEELGWLKVISLKPIFPTERIENLNRLARSYISDFLSKLKNNVNKLDANRVVVDSVSLIEMFVQNEYLARVALSSLIETLKELEVTTLLVGTVPETSEGLTGGGIAEYLVDGIIKMEFTPVAEEYDRTLTIRKMRRTDHSTDIHPFKITSRGLELIEI